MTTDSRLTVPDDQRLAQEWLMERRYTDGLPVVFPTPPLVEEFVEASGLGGEEEVGPIPPSEAMLTVELCAVNAVMAGLSAELMPLLLEVCRAALDTQLNLAGIQATTHPVGIAIVVSGPSVSQYGIEAASGALGPGHRTNMSLGRALRLILMNVGNAWPGQTDMAAFGSPAKLFLVIGEHAAASPWRSHAAREFGDSRSSLTLAPTEGPHNVNDHFSRTADGIARSLASSLAAPGSNDFFYEDARPLVLLNPEHAATLADGGWSLGDLCMYLHENAIAPIWFWGRDNIEGRFERREHDRSHEPLEPVRGPDGTLCYPVLSSPAHVEVFVAGGPGKHSVILPTVGIGVPVSRLLS